MGGDGSAHCRPSLGACRMCSYYHSFPCFRIHICSCRIIPFVMMQECNFNKYIIHPAVLQLLLHIFKIRFLNLAVNIAQTPRKQHPCSENHFSQLLVVLSVLHCLFVAWRTVLKHCMDHLLVTLCR